MTPQFTVGNSNSIYMAWPNTFCKKKKTHTHTHAQGQISKIKATKLDLLNLNDFVEPNWSKMMLLRVILFYFIFTSISNIFSLWVSLHIGFNLGTLQGLLDSLLSTFYHGLK